MAYPYPRPGQPGRPPVSAPYGAPQAGPPRGQFGYAPPTSAGMAGPPRPGMMAPPPTAPGAMGVPPRPGTMAPPPTTPGAMGAPPRPGMMAPPPPAPGAMGAPPRPGMMAPPPPRPGAMGAPPASAGGAMGAPPAARPAMSAAPPASYAAAGVPLRPGMAGPPRPGLMGAPPPRTAPGGTQPGMRPGVQPPPRAGLMGRPPPATAAPPAAAGGPPPRPGLMGPPPTSSGMAGGPPRPGAPPAPARPGLMAPPPMRPPPGGRGGPPPPMGGPPRGPPTGGPPTGPPPTGGPPATAAPSAPAMPAAPTMYAYPAGAGAASFNKAAGGAPADTGMPAAFAGGAYGGPGSYGPGAPGAPGFPAVRAPPIDRSLCCDPKYMNLTVGAIPHNKPLAAQSGLPMGLCVHPLARHPSLPEVPVVDFGAAGVVRCKRCRTYVNPFVTFMDTGRRWRCNMCAFVNDVPAAYMGPIDDQGRRLDAKEHPELSQGSVEFVAPVEYMVRPPQSPVYLFVMDVSYNAVASGMLAATCEAALKALPDLPGGERTQIGFVTFDTSVHFYNLRSTLSAPQMMVVPDVSNLFLPVPEDLLVNLSDSRALVEQLLQSLPKMHAETKHVDTCLGAALDAAFSIIQHIGGKMLVFQASLPSIGRGKLRNRENPKLFGTDQEHTLFAPDASSDAQFYKHKAVEFSRQQISVDSFLMSPSYQDVATIGCLSRYTAGHVYHYPGYTAAHDSERFMSDLVHDLTRNTGFEAVMRIRCTRGLAVTNFYGNFFIRGTDLLALPNVSQDTAFSVEVAHEEDLSPSTVIGIQAALLYTTSSGERRICVHTLAAPVTTVLAEMFKNIDVDSLCNLMSKLALDHMLRTSVTASRLYLHNAVVSVARAYRTATTSAYAAGMPGPQTSSSGGNPPLPEELQLLPLYSMALQKSILFRGGSDVHSDERSALVYRALTMPVLFTKTFIYPRLLALHNLREADGRPVESDADGATSDDRTAGRSTRIQLPAACNLAADQLVSDGVFLLYDGVDTFLWVGRAAPPPLLEALLDTPSLDGIDVSNTVLKAQPNDYSQRVMAIVKALHEGTPHSPRVWIVQEGSGQQSEVRFHYRLVEDRATFHGGANGYGEYLAMVSRESQMAGQPMPASSS